MPRRTYVVWHGLDGLYHHHRDTMTEVAFNRWRETLPGGHILICGWDVTRDEAQRIKVRTACLNRPGLVTRNHEGQPRIDTSPLTSEERATLRDTAQFIRAKRVKVDLP